MEKPNEAGGVNHAKKANGRRYCDVGTIPTTDKFFDPTGCGVGPF